MSSVPCQRIQCVSLETMPIGIFAHILMSSSNEMTESQEVVNVATIPIMIRMITRNVRNLSLVCRQIHQLTNCQKFIQIFLQVLTNKYHKSQAYMAITLDTPGARQWLWNYINMKGYEEVYDTIQEIYALSTAILEEANENGIKFNIRDGIKDRPPPNPSYYQTQTGFSLLVGSFPSGVATPFGEIKLFGHISGMTKNFLSVTEMFIRRMNATFTNIIYSSLNASERNKNRLIPISNHKDDVFSQISFLSGKQISESELRSQKDKQVLVVNPDYGNCTIYSIQRVGKRILSPETWPLPNQEREHEVITAVWEMLERKRLGEKQVAKRKAEKIFS